MPGSRAIPCAASASATRCAPDNPRPRRLRRLAGAVALALTGAVCGAASAGAHIQVAPTVAAPDDAVLFSVLVPSEREVTTTEVVLKIPDGVLPFSFEATPGWRRREIEGPDGAVGRVRWTGSLPPGAFVRFSFLASTPATSGAIAWKALQRYADGRVVRWIGAPGSETPAAVTTVTPGASKQNAGGESAGGTAPAATSRAPRAAADEDTLPLILAGLALLVALAALLIVLSRRPRRAP